MERSGAEGLIRNTNRLLLLSNAVAIAFHIKMKCRHIKMIFLLLIDEEVLFTNKVRGSPYTKNRTPIGINYAREARLIFLTHSGL